MLRGSFYIIPAIQNQFSEVENSKFYEILQNLFLVKNSIFLYKNRFLDLKKTEKTKKKLGKTRKHLEKPGFMLRAALPN